jgi:putative transcriptional regulator
MWRRLPGVLLFVVLFAPPAGSQGRVTQVAPGKFLVAARKLNDPNFAETVVLLIQHDASSTAGLIINRATRLPVSAAFKDLKAAQERSDRVYIGGPVGRTGILMLVRSRIKRDDLKHVFADVYLANEKAAVERALASGMKDLRVFAGYSGWGQGQLEAEIASDAWHVTSGDADAVFDPDPSSMWRRLIQQTELRFAWLAPRAAR